MLQWIFANISAKDGSFFKPIFALKPSDRDGRVEYNKRYKRSKKEFKIVVHVPQKFTRKPKIAEKLDLIGRNGY